MRVMRLPHPVETVLLADLLEPEPEPQPELGRGQAGVRGVARGSCQADLHGVDDDDAGMTTFQAGSRR